jgi:hypothetical protein
MYQTGEMQIPNFSRLLKIVGSFATDLQELPNAGLSISRRYYQITRRICGRVG